MMEKNARVEEGKTPSAVSGKPCTHVREGEPLCGNEKCKSVKQVKTKDKERK